VPVYASPDADNHPGLGPAGTVSCSLADWAKFVGLFARGDPKGLVTPESFAELQRFEDGYAGGWGTVRFNWTKEVGLGHSGSNTMNFCTAYVSPGARVMLLGVSNVADPGAAAIEEAFTYLTRQHLKRRR
jgi:hypothetical protein